MTRRDLEHAALHRSAGELAEHGVVEGQVQRLVHGLQREGAERRPLVRLLLRRLTQRLLQGLVLAVTCGRGVMFKRTLWADFALGSSRLLVFCSALPRYGYSTT